MKIKVLIIFILFILINIDLIRASNLQWGMNQIIEIDNILSRDKAKNTSNPNVKEVEQNNPIYFHYIKDCGITNIDDKESGIQKARYEFYTHDDFEKNKNTLLFIPLVERDFPVEFNCTKEILTIKSISPSNRQFH